MMLHESIHIVWALAGQEAMEAGYTLVEPDHLLLGVLKLAELRGSQLAKAVSDEAAFSEIIKGRDSLRQCLAKRGYAIPERTREIRHELRRRLGKKDPPPGGSAPLHRSDASRRVFKAAEKLAAKNGVRFWDAADLATVLLSDPPHNAMDLLLDVPSTPAPTDPQPGQETPGEFDPGERGGEKPAPDQDPVCVVLSDYLAERGQGVYCLMSRGRRTPAGAVSNLTAYLKKHAPKELKSLGLVEIGAERDVLEIKEAVTGLKGKEGQIVFLDLTGTEEPPLIRAWLNGLASSGLFCLTGLTHAGYQAYMAEHDGSGAKPTPIWLHDLAGLDTL